MTRDSQGRLLVDGALQTRPFALNGARWPLQNRRGRPTNATLDARKRQNADLGIAEDDTD